MPYITWLAATQRFVFNLLGVYTVPRTHTIRAPPYTRLRQVFAPTRHVTGHGPDQVIGKRRDRYQGYKNGLKVGKHARVPGVWGHHEKARHPRHKGQCPNQSRGRKGVE